MSRNWMKYSETPNSSVWVKGDSEVVVPNKGTRDFVLRVSEVLKELERSESRSQLQIFREFLLSGFDLVRLASRGPQTENGTLSLDEGSRFVANAHDLLLAAALSSVEPRPSYTGKKPKLASDFMHRARLGQTEEGSFVLTILAPVSADETEQGGQLDLGQPFGRIVTTKLLEATREASAAAAASISKPEWFKSEFRPRVSKGVSANLCAALAGIFSIEGTDEVELDIGWSATVPHPQFTSSSVKIPASTSHIFADAARELRKDDDRSSTSLVGPVVKLEKGEGQTKGQVTFIGVVDGTHKKVKINLEGEDYDQATEAHKTGQLIAVKGIVTHAAKSFSIPDVETFRVVDEASLFSR